MSESLSSYDCQQNLALNSSTYLIPESSYRTQLLPTFDPCSKLESAPNLASYSKSFHASCSQVLPKSNTEYSKSDRAKQQPQQWQNGYSQEFKSFDVDNVGGGQTLYAWNPSLCNSLLQTNVNSSSDENMKQLLYVTNHCHDNNLSGYTFVTNSCSQPHVSGVWQQNQNGLEYIFTKNVYEANNRRPSTEFNNSVVHGSPNETTNNGTFGNNLFPGFLTPQPQNMFSSEICAKNIESHNFPKRWLLKNFEKVDEECTIARSLMYSYYVHACHERGECPMNSAGLGKVIRGVFGNIKNRRLGARGDSRYHYLGIRVRNDSYILNIPSATLNKLSSLYSRSLKTTGKAALKDRNESSQTSSPLNNSSDLSSQICEFKKLLIDLQCYDELGKTPLRYQTQPIKKIRCLEVRVKLDELADPITNQIYQGILREICDIMSRCYTQVTDCICEMNEHGLFNTVKSFWTDPPVISAQNVQSLERILNKQSCYSSSSDSTDIRSPDCDFNREVHKNYTMKDCIRDSLIEKYLYYHDCTFFQILINQVFTNVKEITSLLYCNQVLNMFIVWKNALMEGLANYPKSFMKYKMASMNSLLLMTEEICRLNSTRFTCIQAYVNEKDEVKEISKLCSSAQFLNVMDDFHARYFLIFKSFILPTSELSNLFIKMTLLPYESDSKEWLGWMESQINKFQSYALQSESILSTAVQNWYTYQAFLLEEISQKSQKRLPTQLPLNSLFIRFSTILINDTLSRLNGTFPIQARADVFLSCIRTSS